MCTIYVPVMLPAAEAILFSPGCSPWTPMEEASSLPDFYEIRMTLDRHLSAAEISRASGCLGYALKEVLCGEELSLPYIIQSRRAGQTVLLYWYDVTKSRRDDPDYEYAFAVALRYLEEGTPKRLTNRAGVGTQGSRLVEGIGRCRVNFAVR